MDEGSQGNYTRKGRIILLVFLLLILLTGVYIIVQYSIGKSQTAGDTGLKHGKGTLEAFNGQKDSNGNTNILLLGVDKRKGQTQSNSDTMIIAQYNPENKSVKMVSLMRDMFVDVPGYDGRKKMNASFFLGGPELVRQTIKQNFDIDVQYYAMIDFKGFEKVIDALEPDGVEVNVEKAMSKNIGVSLKPGLQKLNGKELLGYARFRHDADSDFGRVKRQQKVIEIVLDNVMSANGILKAPKLLGTIQPYIQTNLGSVERLSLAKDLLLHQPKITKTLSLPVKGTYTDERDPVYGLGLAIDKEANRQAIHDFLNESDSTANTEDEKASTKTAKP
jgi:LCP family protein required for cell wall assembly